MHHRMSRLACLGAESAVQKVPPPTRVGPQGPGQVFVRRLGRQAVSLRSTAGGTLDGAAADAEAAGSVGLSYKSSFYGFYIFPLSRVNIWQAPCANTEQTVQMLHSLRNEYPDRHLVLVWDGVSYHRSQLVRETAALLSIALMPLPGYSPDLMPVEALWRWLRQVVTGNYCYQSIAELHQRVANFVFEMNLDPDTLAARSLIHGSARVLLAEFCSRRERCHELAKC